MSLKSHHYAAFLFIIVCAVFAITTTFDFVTWDDGNLVYDNLLVKNFSPSIWWSYDPELYIPLTLLSFQLEYLFVGLSPWLYHGTNVVLHGLNTVLVFFLSLHVLTLHACPEHGRRVARSKAESQDQIPSKLFPAFLCSLLFALHPIQVEAVAWVSARKDLLSTFFFLLSLLAFLSYSDGERRGNRPSTVLRMTPAAYLFSLLCFLLALLSKVTVVTLPAILLLIHFYQGTLSKQTAKRTIPFFGLSILFMIIAVFGKTQNLVSLGPIEMVLISAKATVFYLQKFLWPVGLSAIYPQTTPIAISSAEFFVPLAILLFSSVALVTLYKRRLFDYSIIRLFAFGSAFFLITLSPNFFNAAKAEAVYFASDRYVYVPMVGLVMIAGVLVSEVGNRARRAVALLGVIGIVCVCAIVSYRQALVWRTSESLYTHVLTHYPDSHAALNNLAKVYIEDERLGEAKQLLQRAIEVKPDFAYAYLNLGIAYRREKDFEQAQQLTLKAIELKPGLKRGYFNLGRILEDQGEVDAAIAEYKTLIEIDPENIDALWQLGHLYGKKGMYLEGVQMYRRAMELDPSRAEQAEELDAILEKLE